MSGWTRGASAERWAFMPSGLKAAALALLFAALPLLATASLARGPESVAGVAEG